MKKLSSNERFEMNSAIAKVYRYGEGMQESLRELASIMGADLGSSIRSDASINTLEGMIVESMIFKNGEGVNMLWYDSLFDKVHLYRKHLENEEILSKSETVWNADTLKSESRTSVL